MSHESAPAPLTRPGAWSDLARRPDVAQRTCAVEGCEKPARSDRGRGWCSMHNERWRTFGSTDLPTRSSVEERFWAKVDQSGGPDACHEWLGSRNALGYGRFNPGGGPMLASRWLLGHLRGEMLAADEQALHRCDNPPCCNSAHLFVGTRADNMRDAAEKGRMVGRRTLSSEDVAAIRREYAAGGVSQASLAARFGVRQPAISRIVTGERWSRCR